MAILQGCQTSTAARAKPAALPIPRSLPSPISSSGMSVLFASSPYTPLMTLFK